MNGKAKKLRTLLSASALCVVLGALCTVFFSCGSVQTTKSGKPDTAKLEIVADTDVYFDTVHVSIDGGTPFTAEINDINKNKHKYQYTIPTGSHDITISQSNAVVVAKKIFASAGEVKVVELP
ncbi:MAG: hypothetical protein IJ828_05990 [Treponema sp.]|nr:hypothetical protein [Treponema sp.]